MTAPELDEVTSVVSINAPSRQTLAEGLYLRDRSRGKYVRPAAGYLATGTNRTLDLEYPILGHGLARNGLVHLQFADPHTQAIYDAARQALGTAIFTDWWPGDVDVFVLGDPQPISIPIGTAPIRGTRSYLRRILHTAPQLDGQPTV
ncbi:hypothetical protein [Gordonia amicalis]|uniref:Uncharacterized protein n=1 Tax=Gordonia amicalis TaxID=89053 RepID=A0ABU4DLX2_9ACTN|nr:hypothetical protein [Gordonia amicalis]MDV6310021.1 hypothetical protein [Gordonia amicalis]